MTRFIEQEIIAQKLAYAGSRLRMLIRPPIAFLKALEN
jgi:hypothetical protein